MSAYFIVEVEITDPIPYEGYKPLAASSIEKYGGRFKVRGGKAELIEGVNPPKRVVVIEFDSVEAVKRWYNSREYQDALAIRQRASKSRAILVEGL
ncbi:MAG TPA: DUF1330 domain-containing protein [Stellaceae bacterium]|nr:DUF1330 domain-containing protein [Stellaceae bacterium]